MAWKRKCRITYQVADGVFSKKGTLVLQVDKLQREVSAPNNWKARGRKC